VKGIQCNDCGRSAVRGEACESCGTVVDWSPLPPDATPSSRHQPEVGPLADHELNRAWIRECRAELAAAGERKASG
jgi:hypothetical protein